MAIAFKVSPTQLVNYQDYMSDSITYEELIKRYRGDFIPSVYMEIGTKFHKVVETSIPNDIFSDEANELARKTGERFSFHELKVRKTMEVRGFTVVLSGMCDGMTGDVIHEVKTRYSYINYDIVSKYQKSLQGLCYSYLFDCSQVVYHIVCLKKRKDGTYTLTDYAEVDVNNNDAEARLRTVLNGFIEFILCNNLNDIFEINGVK